MPAALARRLFGLVAALAVLAVALFGGQRFFYCASMARVAAVECCAHGQAHAEPSAVPLRRCCEAGTFASAEPAIAGGATDEDQAVPPPLLALPLALVTANDALFACVTACKVHPARAGPSELRAGPLAWRTRIDVSLS